MSSLPKNHMTASCSCGNVELEATGTPVLSNVCYCDDCQEGSRRIEALPNASPVRDPDGGTAYILYRKDRVKCSRGAPLLGDYKIREGSATNRVVADVSGLRKRALAFYVPDTVSGSCPTRADAYPNQVQVREQRRSERRAQLRGVPPQVYGEARCCQDCNAASSMSRGGSQPTCKDSKPGAKVPSRWAKGK